MAPSYGSVGVEMKLSLKLGSWFKFKSHVTLRFQFIVA